MKTARLARDLDHDKNMIERSRTSALKGYPVPEKMKIFDYICDGQMSLFDLPVGIHEESTVKCTSVNECEAYPKGCEGTIEPCRFGGPYNWSEKGGCHD